MTPALISSSAKVFVFSCIDPRFQTRLEEHLIQDKKLHGDYDAFNLAGAELGAIKDVRWRKTFFEHLQLGIDLHGINYVYCYSHLDCGFYKAMLGIEKDDQVSEHSKYLRRMKKTIQRQFPNLGFRGFVMMLDGKIKEVVKG